jgi:hypothetical protein
MDSIDTVPYYTRSANVSREAWVEMQLIHAFMRYARPALHAAMVLIVVIVGILYRHVDTLALAVWAMSAMLVTLIRYHIIDIYHRDLVGISGPRLHTFMARYTWTWPLSAVIWGSSMFVFFLTAPIYDQFVCMLVLVGMAGFAVGTFSAHMPCFTGYVHGLGLSVMAALGWQLFREGGIPATFNTYGIVALVLIYWIVIRISGQRFHEVQRDNLILQFDNSELISSLTAESHAALEAVDIKNRFIASAAHDLRQPVHALGLYADWLSAEPEYAAMIAPKIARSTKAVNDMFESLFDMAGLAIRAGPGCGPGGWQLRPALDVEPPEEPPQMNLHGVLADLQFFGDVAVAHALVEHHQQLLLPLGELFGRGAGFRVQFFAEEDAQHVGDLGGAGRLLDIGVRARLDGEVLVVLGRRGRQHHQGHVGELLLELAHAGNTVGVGQAQVQADQLGNALFLHGGHDGGEPVQLGHGGLAAQAADQHDNRFAHERVVIYYKNTH